MSNHYHVVVHVNPDAAKSWSDDQVIGRWRRVFTLPDTVTADHAERWRQRLCSLSWYMRCLNEPLARFANREDDCNGRFWEGRFHSQALLDEVALLKCMTYVDLNPIRAGVAVSTETSMHTSIKARIERRDKHLMPMQGASRKYPCVPMRRRDYLQLVDWTGRCVRVDKRGHIPHRAPPILDRLRFSGSAWVREIAGYGRWYFRAVGSWATMQRYCEHLGQQWLKGASRQRFTAGACSVIG
jgi:hypothetical protein